MADVKNFGLIGVGSSLQFSKGGAKLVNNAGTFNFKAANGTADTAVTASALTATTGDLAATLGNLTLSATGATITVGTDTVQGDVEITATFGKNSASVGSAQIIVSYV